MFDISNIVLPNPLAEKLDFLKNFGVEFGGFVANIDTDSGRILVPMLFFAFILVLFFKNSMEKRDSFKPNYKNLFFMAALIYTSFLSMITVKSEFLYFNF